MGRTGKHNCMWCFADLHRISQCGCHNKGFYPEENEIKESAGARRVAQQLRMLAAFSEDQSSAPNTYASSSQPPVTTAPRNVMLSSVVCGCLPACVCANTHIHRNNKIKIKINQKQTNKREKTRENLLLMERIVLML